MPRNFYTDYARHAFRFYFAYPRMTVFKSKADENNHKAVKAVLDGIDVETIRLLMFIFTSAPKVVGCSTTAAVDAYCSSNGRISTDDAFARISNAYEKFAKIRGLI